MPQANFRPRHATLLRRAAQLMRQFIALRQAGGAERMPFREQAARWIGHHLAI